MIRNLPNLKIIKTRNVVLHEETEPARVLKLKKAIIKDKVLKDPPIVAKIGRGRYAVLDGANRTTVFKELKIPSILVQVVDYKKPAVDLKTWNHLICDQGFKKYYDKQVKRFKITDIKAMLDFTRRYKKQFTFYRVLSNNFQELKKQYRNATCLVIFPKFKPRDIIKFALHNKKIPSGITRHLVSSRALRVDLPLSLLNSKKSLPEKNKWLEKIIQNKLLTKQIRFYSEPTFLFDE